MGKFTKVARNLRSYPAAKQSQWGMPWLDRSRIVTAKSSAAGRLTALTTRNCRPGTGLTRWPCLTKRARPRHWNRRSNCPKTFQPLTSTRFAGARAPAESYDSVGFRGALPAKERGCNARISGFVAAIDGVVPVPGLEEIAVLRSGECVPADRVIELRSTGMAAIRTELVHRLLRASSSADSFMIYWENGHQTMLTGQVEAVVRKLVCGSRNRVIGEFPDLWLLCYPDDGDAKQSVEREVDRMVAAVITLR